MMFPYIQRVRSETFTFNRNITKTTAFIYGAIVNKKGKK